MNILQLKNAIADLPDDMEVILQKEQPPLSTTLPHELMSTEDKEEQYLQ